MCFKVGQTDHKQRDMARGTALVEMAIMLPFLCLLLCGVMEFSILIHDKAVITNASREGVRYGIAAAGGPYSDTQIETWVSNYVQDHLISFQAASAVTTIGRLGNTPGSDLTVKVVYPYSFLVFPNFAQGFGSVINLSAETTMLLE